jgi:hypothetical protein
MDVQYVDCHVLFVLALPHSRQSPERKYQVAIVATETGYYDTNTYTNDTENY